MIQSCNKIVINKCLGFCADLIEQIFCNARNAVVQAQLLA